MNALCQSETLMDLAPQYGRLFNTLGFCRGPSPPPRVLHHKADRVVLCSMRTHAMQPRAVGHCPLSSRAARVKVNSMHSAKRPWSGVDIGSALGPDFDWPGVALYEGCMDLRIPSEQSNDP